MIALVLAAAICNAEVCPERQNDFCWENDKFGMRAYGPGEFHKWSGFDVFNKADRAEATCSYVLHNHDKCGNWHETPYKGILDNYTMGASRGVGGIAMFADGEWKMTCHITLRRGERFFRNDVSFEKGMRDFWVGPGLDLEPKRGHKGDTLETCTRELAIVALYEEEKSEVEGSTATAIMMEDEPEARIMTDNQNCRVIAVNKQKFTYYAGAAWSKEGKITDLAKWHEAIIDFLAAAVNFTVQTAVHPDDFKTYDTAKIRERFVMEKVMAPDEINLTYTMYDRLVYGGAMPVSKELTLEPFEELKAEHFLDRRELGVINVGGPGTVTVDGEKYDLEFKEALYVGCGKKEVKFASKDSKNPAKFYLNSAPAYKEFVTQRITSDQNCKKPGYTIGNYIKAGKMEESNDRVINQLIVNPVLTKVPGGGVNQLQMGLTELKPGSVWNTMPQHTHNRRMEAYFYFNVPEGQAICHQMGRPQEQRLVWLHNEQAITAPEWSVHSAAGTSNYMFVWGMAGENLNYGDMDKVPVTEMR